jgi:hypothetical protein
MFPLILWICDTLLFVMVFYAVIVRSEYNESNKPFLSAFGISEKSNEIDTTGPCRPTIEIVWSI